MYILLTCIFGKENEFALIIYIVTVSLNVCVHVFTYVWMCLRLSAFMIGVIIKYTTGHYYFNNDLPRI